MKKSKRFYEEPKKLNDKTTTIGRCKQMDNFNRLVSEQMETMEKLLFLQSEIERCQGLEQELKKLQEEAKLESIREDIEGKKRELKEIHEIFERQTEELIQSYQEVNALV